MSTSTVPAVPVPDPRPDTPVPFGVIAETGETRPPMQPPAPDEVGLDAKEVRRRGQPQNVLAAVPTVDPKDLTQAGWGILFTSDADPAIRAALEPLIRRREAQVGNPDYFRVYEGKDGVKPGQTAINWLAAKGVTLAMVDPDNGVPYHLLIVGPPSRIPYEFQYTLDLQWSVGRIDFDTPEEYAAYARNVVAYETAPAPPHGKSAALWMPANGDLATSLLCNDVGLPFMQKPLGKKQGFRQTSFLATTATKQKLTEILAGSALDGAPPAVLFTGSHGLEVGSADAADQRERQGAIVTQEWRPGKAVSADASYCAADLPANIDLKGMMHVLFACFGGGCPEKDNYPEGGAAPKQLIAQPIVSRLVQRLLARGALAVVAHIDRAWNYSFQGGSGLPQNQVLRAVIESLMLGLPAGLAVDPFNLQWGTLAAHLGNILGPTAPTAPPPASLASLVVARDDARNYALFGDPAVRLRTSEMS